MESPVLCWGHPGGIKILGDDPKVFHEQTRPGTHLIPRKMILYTTLYCGVWRILKNRPWHGNPHWTPPAFHGFVDQSGLGKVTPKPSVGQMSLAEVIHHECWCGCVVRELVCEGIFLFFRKIAKGMLSSPMFAGLILERFHVLSRATAYEVMVANAKSWWEYVPKQWQTHFSIQCIMFRLFRHNFLCNLVH